MMFVGVGPGSAGTPGLHHASFLPPDDAVADVASVMLAGYLGACTTAGDRHHGSGGTHSAMP
jgi:hypothetical protein